MIDNKENASMRYVILAFFTCIAMLGCSNESKVNAPTTTESGADYRLSSGERQRLDTPSLTSYAVEAKVRLSDANANAGLAFHAQTGAENFKGFYTGLDAKSHTVFLLKGNKEMARRSVSVEPGVWYSLRLEVSGDNYVLYVNDNPLAENQFPKYDAVDSTYTSGDLALRVASGSADFKEVKVTAFEKSVSQISYQNPVQPGCADPGLMKHESRYYAYCTYTPDYPTMVNGIRLYTSDDLVNWEDQGFVLKNEDSWGESRFWAPDIVARDGVFYLYYAVDERIAVATSESPLGPFVQGVKEPMAPESIKIDAYVFEDDDGKRYFYYVGFDNGNHIWGAELNDDMKTIKSDTVKLMISPEEPWETHMANVAEGAEIIKHKGVYYLTYSGSHFESPHYSVGYATASHPLGPWSKYENNPIMKSTSYAHGTAHHSLVRSPDDSELFIVYHQHNDLYTTEPRQMSIDRMQFVPQENGPDILEAWGPTVSPQPMPK